MCGKCASCEICIHCPANKCDDCDSMFCQGCYYKCIETDGGQNIDIVYFVCPVCPKVKGQVSDKELLEYILEITHTSREEMVLRFQRSNW